MTTARNFGAGTKLKVKEVSTWRDVLGITSIGGFTPTSDDVDATEVDPYAGSSTTPATYNFIKKTIAGWVELGELTFDANLTGGEYAALLALQLAGTDVRWRIDFRTGYSVGLYGHVKSVGMSNAPTELTKMPVTIKLTDSIIFGLLSAIPLSAW